MNLGESNQTASVPVSGGTKARPTDPGAGTEARRKGRRLRILLVEDNFADALLVTKLFELSRFPADIDRAQDGQTALDYLFGRLAAPASLPDVILLDLNLPGKNGFDVLRELEMDPALKDIPVLVLTTSRSEEDLARAFSQGVALVLGKPVDLPGYEDLVRRLISLEIPRVVSGRPRGSRSRG